MKRKITGAILISLSLVSLGFALAAGEAGRTGTISTRINVQLSVPSCDVNEAVKLGGELKTVIDFRIFLGTESDGVLGTAHVTALTSFTTATGVSTGTTYRVSGQTSQKIAVRLLNEQGTTTFPGDFTVSGEVHGRAVRFKVQYTAQLTVRINGEVLRDVSMKFDNFKAVCLP
jgi:hypothetical protein